MTKMVDIDGKRGILLFKDESLDLIVFQSVSSIILTRYLHRPHSITDHNNDNVRDLKVPSEEQLDIFIKNQIKERKSRNDWNVNEQTKMLFERLGKTLPVRYENNCIVVLDQVLIDEKLETCRLLQGSVSTLHRVQQILYLEKQKLGI
jgi:hypothetical protein